MDLHECFHRLNEQIGRKGFPFNITDEELIVYDVYNFRALKELHLTPVQIQWETAFIKARGTRIRRIDGSYKRKRKYGESTLSSKDQQLPKDLNPNPKKRRKGSTKKKLTAA